MNGFQVESRIDIGKKRDSNQDALFADLQAGLFAVADGMGGMSFGEIASRMVIESMEAFAFMEDKSVEAWIHLIHEFNNELYDLAHGTSGSTLSALWIHDYQANIVHIGDSRIYHWSHNANVVKQVTQDHNNQFHKNVLNRYFGDIYDVPLDTVDLVINPGDRFLLCSDGLHGEVNDECLVDTLRSRSKPVENIVSELVQQALDNGGKDNISIIVVEVG